MASHTVASRNNTSYPSIVTAKLQALHKEYLAAQNDPSAPDHVWTVTLKYYQYIVRAVMINPEYGVGKLNNSRGLLVYHAMGMGKTRLAAAVVAALWDTREVIIILNKSLQSNFMNTIIQVIELTSDRDDIEKIKAFAKLRVSFVSMDAYNSAEQARRTQGASNPFENKLLIIDECHNFFRAIINSASDTNARQLYDMIMSANNARLLFLTGTPAAKDPFELVPCFNMLTKTDLLPVFYESFYSLYVDTAIRKVRNRAKLANRIMGLVSHVDPHKATIDSASKKAIRSDGWFPEEHPVIVEYVEMGEDQYRKYIIAREREENEGKTSFNGSTAAALSSPALSIPGSAKKSAKTYNVRSRNLSTFYLSDEWSSVSEMPPHAFTQEIAPKLALIADRVLAAQGPVLVYSQFVESGGLKPLGRFLQNVGYNYFDPAKPGSQYAIISGEISSEMRDQIVSTFNSVQNMHGELIKAILISKTGAEGLDLKWIRETHQVEPYWDKARDHQVISRSVRLGSHDGLPTAEREVQPYIYIGVHNKIIYDQMMPENRENISIDTVFFNRANERFEINADFRKLLSEVCMECTLFKYENCRSCAPTNRRLFNTNATLDIKLPDPCELRYETDVTVKSIIADSGSTYYYAKSVDSIGYTFYLYDESINGYVTINESAPIIVELLQKI
jgi:hypothetical protein